MLTSAARHDEVLDGGARCRSGRGRAGSAYRKLRQPASGFALVGVAARVDLDRRGRIERAALGVTGVNAVPFRAAERRGAPRRRRARRPRRCATPARRIDEADPMEDLHASAEYRAHLLSVLAARALGAACARAAA